MSSVVVFDTSVFIDHLRTGCHQERFESVTGLIRTSSVVLAELWRGAREPEEKAFLKELGKNHPNPDPNGKELAGVGTNTWQDPGRYGFFV